MKEMQPFVYGDLVKAVLEKPKFSALGRTYLTHLNPPDVYELAERDKALKGKINVKDVTEKTKQQVLAIKRQN
jgi:hypothetical protein